MKIYFSARSDARKFKAAAKSNVVVVDSKINPSRKGSRWAVEVARPR